MRKKFLKKISTVGLAAVAAVGLLAGCGKTDQSSKSSKTIYRTVDEIKKSGTINKYRILDTLHFHLHTQMELYLKIRLY